MSETTVDTTALGEEIRAALRGLKLPTLAVELVPRLIAAGFHEAIPVVREVLEMERHDRWERRVERLRYRSNLPPGKTFETFKMERLPRPLAAKIRELSRGEFVDRCGNVLSVGLPGTGKSHVSSGLGHALVERGHSVLWVPTFKLVQDLLAAKRDLSLPRALRKLDAFEVLILDDIGYVQQAAEEVEVLFTLLAERYERRSVVITTNLVFSKWDQIFKNPMTTAAAIDRLIHHCTILEFDVESYRSEEAERAAGGALPAESEMDEPREPKGPPRSGRRRSKERGAEEHGRGDSGMVRREA